MAEILTAEQVKDFYEDDLVMCDPHLVSLCDSHEALRAERDALKRENVELGNKQVIIQSRLSRAEHARSLGKDTLDKTKAYSDALEAENAELRAKLAEAEKDTARLDKLEQWLQEHLYHHDLSIQSDVEDGVWVTKLWRYDCGELRGAALDVNHTKTETVRAAIDAMEGR